LPQDCISESRCSEAFFFTHIADVISDDQFINIVDWLAPQIFKELRDKAGSSNHDEII
jgi:hypothetical protein